MNRTRRLIGLLMFLGLVAMACGTAATPVSQPAPVPTTTPTISPTAALGATMTPSQKRQAARKVELQTTTSLKFYPSKIRVEPSESIEFVITDTSGFPHTFTIATSRAKQQILQDVTIVGQQTKSVRVTFPEETGTLYLFCRPHEWAGMIGMIGVGVEPSDPNGPGTDYRS